MTEEQKKDFDPDGTLNDLMADYKNFRIYFTDDRYRKPTSRYEAWLMASCLSNLIIAKTLEKVCDEFKTIVQNATIFQKQPDSNIIKETKEPEIIPNLKRRKKE